MMTSLRSLSVDAWRQCAFQSLASAERELATAETFIRLGDWEGAALKLDQAILSYTTAAKAFREMEAGQAKEMAS